MKPMAILFLAIALLTAGCGDESKTPEPSGPVAAKGVSDADLSLLRGSVFDTPTPEAVAWATAMPGANEKVPHLFRGAPPVVPHGIDDFLPIGRAENGCLECHLSADEDPDEVPQLPDSHRTDLRAASDRVSDAVAGSRHVCLLCHVPLSDAKPLPELAPDADG